MTLVLLVEDNDVNREMMVRRLQRAGYEVLEAVDGQQAVDRARAETPSVILMDLSLPIMDGWEATRLLKADDSTRSIPIIALTAHAMVEDRARALQAGCDGYATKPVQFKELLATMAKVQHLPAGE